MNPGPLIKNDATATVSVRYWFVHAGVQDVGSFRGEGVGGVGPADSMLLCPLACFLVRCAVGLTQVDM